MLGPRAEHIQTHQFGVKVIGDELERRGDVQEVSSVDGPICSTNSQLREGCRVWELMDRLGYGDLINEIHIPSCIKTLNHTTLENDTFTDSFRHIPTHPSRCK